MSQVMKSYMGIFLIMFLAMVSMGVLSAFMTVIDARDTHAKVIDELENSNYCTDVIRELLDEADSKKYQLKITMYQDGGEITITDKAHIPGNTEHVRMAKVALTFPFQVAFFGMRDMHTISGYAR